MLLFIVRPAECEIGGGRGSSDGVVGQGLGGAARRNGGARHG